VKFFLENAIIKAKGTNPKKKNINPDVYFIATIGAMFTTLYSVKVLYLTFLTPIVNINTKPKANNIDGVKVLYTT
jgi:NADH:ubiquinone oxidoreductase subunit 5 (subunit L)/multisubunit Na+/H+ antiporter MnhA subunit